MSTNKPRLDPLILQDQGITYYENIVASRRGTSGEDCSETIRLPDHVESVREALLDFGSPLSRTIRHEFQRERRAHGVARTALPPDSAYYDDQMLSTRSREARAAAARSDFEENEEIAEEARRLQSSHVSKDEWALFMRTNIFKRYKDVFPSSPQKEELYDKWALESNIVWKEARTYANLDRRLKQRTGPKPDLTYGFPINKTIASLSHGLRQEEAVENFSLKVLAELRQNELISSPQTSLLTWARDHKTRIYQPGLLCFPWAIVELKPVEGQKHPVQFCYCQAANEASAALKIYENLSSRARGELDDQVPPVIAFTCVGPEIRVWLAYSCTKESQRNCHKMVCIWKNTLSATWGVMATRFVISNMHFWASRVLRPKISNYLSQVRMNARLAVIPGPLGASPNRSTLVNDESLPDNPSTHSQISACSMRTIPATESQATDLLAESTPPGSATRPSMPPANTVLPETSPTSMPPLSQSTDSSAPSEQLATPIPRSPIQSGGTEVDDLTVLTTPCREDDSGRLAPAQPRTTSIEDADAANHDGENASRQLDEGSSNKRTSNIQDLVDKMRNLRISIQDAAANPIPGTPATRELPTNTAYASNSASATLTKSVRPLDVPCSITPSSSTPATSMLAFGTSPTGGLSSCTSNLNTPQAFIGPGTEKFPFIPYIERDRFGEQHYQTIAFQAPHVKETLEELRLADYGNNRKGGNAAMVPSDATATASALISTKSPSTDPAATALRNGVLSASMGLSARPSMSPPATDISTSDTLTFNKPAFSAPATSDPAIRTLHTNTSLLSTSSRNALPQSVSSWTRPSEDTSAARMQSSQAWKQASERREEDLGDAQRAARGTPSVATVVDLGSESESSHDSSEHLDDETVPGDETIPDDEEDFDDERPLDGKNEDSDDSEESGESTSNREDDAPRQHCTSASLPNRTIIPGPLRALITWFTT